MSTATGIDAVTQQIVGNALASIADEMATTIFRTAHSTVVRDGMDFSAAICDSNGETVAQGVTVPFHMPWKSELAGSTAPNGLKFEVRPPRPPGLTRDAACSSAGRTSASAS